MASNEPQVGAVVEIPVGRGVVRFSGTTSFAPGKWIGIELYEPKGKNDGSIGGVPYFQCKMQYGVFVRPSQVKQIVAQPPPPAPAAPVSGLSNLTYFPCSERVVSPISVLLYLLDPACLYLARLLCALPHP